MGVKNGMTADFLRFAYDGESVAHIRYLIWGEIAQNEGFPNIAALFEAISYAERVHAMNHFREIEGDTADEAVSVVSLFRTGKTIYNLQGAINGELHEAEQMYPVYLNTAQLQNEIGAQRSFRFALEAEKTHAKLFKQARDAVKEGNDLEFDAVYICSVCGNTILDGALEDCPICGAQKGMYHKF